MSGISTHVLNTATGRPAGGIAVSFYRGQEELEKSVTNADGRCKAAFALEAGVYRLVFHLEQGFYPEIQVTFRVEDPSANYHVPLLLSPYGYTTYRGS